MAEKMTGKKNSVGTFQNSQLIHLRKTITKIPLAFRHPFEMIF
jgi:hypothetical protein